MSDACDLDGPILGIEEHDDQVRARVAPIGHAPCVPIGRAASEARSGWGATHSIDYRLARQTVPRHLDGRRQAQHDTAFLESGGFRATIKTISRYFSVWPQFGRNLPNSSEVNDSRD